MATLLPVTVVVVVVVEAVIFVIIINMNRSSSSNGRSRSSRSGSGSRRGALVVVIVIMAMAVEELPPVRQGNATLFRNGFVTDAVVASMSAFVSETMQKCIKVLRCFKYVYTLCLDGAANTGTHPIGS